MNGKAHLWTKVFGNFITSFQYTDILQLKYTPIKGHEVIEIDSLVVALKQANLAKILLCFETIICYSVICNGEVKYIFIHS